jgi:hypothetical protein
MKIKLPDYGYFAPVIFHWHSSYDSEWHFSIFQLEWEEHERSLISIGKRYDMWFIDLFWKRLLPRDDEW